MKKIKSLSLYITIFLVLVNCNLFSQTDTIDKYEDIIYEKISRLPEYKRLLKFKEKEQDTICNLAIMIVSTPTKEEPYYTVKVGNSCPEIFFTSYDFVIYINKKIIIKYYDPIEDKIISLNKLRKKRKW